MQIPTGNEQLRRRWYKHPVQYLTELANTRYQHPTEGSQGTKANTHVSCVDGTHAAAQGFLLWSYVHKWGERACHRCEPQCHTNHVQFSHVEWHVVYDTAFHSHWHTAQHEAKRRVNVCIEPPNKDCGRTFGK